MPVPHFLETLLDRPIAFQRVFAELTKSITAGLMLSQALYWSKRTKDDGGWFYKRQFEWFDETYMTRREQDTARAILRNQKRKGDDGKLLPPFWFEERRGLPAKIFYRVDFESLSRHLQALDRDNAQIRQTEDDVQPDLTGVSSNGNAQNRQTRLAENANLDDTNPPNRTVRKRQSGMNETANHSSQRLLTQITSETTSSSKTRARPRVTATMKCHPIQELYCKLTGNRWQPRDEETAVKFQAADMRHIEIAMIETLLLTEQPKIHSFNYFVPRLQEWIGSTLGEETLNIVLQIRRDKWAKQKGLSQ